MTGFAKLQCILGALYFCWSVHSVDADYIESTPSFVSGWINMTANSATSEQTILHGLQELPMMVRVDAKTEEGWIFTGFGSAQKDDDGGYTYGGVVFIYSNTSIKIFVPKRSNDRSTATWTALYLGDEQKWIGPAHMKRRYSSILVRVKAWRSSDLPPPSFKSRVIHITKGDCLEEAVDHSLGKYPDLIVVQIRTPLWTFQGQGLSTRGTGDKYSNIGGLLYGHNETHVQLWSACNTDGTMPGIRLLSVTDGWGHKGVGSNEGSITIFAWNIHGHIQRFKISDLEAAGYMLPYTHVKTPSHFLSVQIEVLDDPNKNFRFDGVGSVMSEMVPFGGLVYGHNDTDITFWVPHPLIRDQTNVAMYMLGKIWGMGYRKQMADDVDIIISEHDVFVPICILDYTQDMNTKLSVITKSSKYNDSVYAVGDEIQVHCMTGYRSLGGNTSLTCNETGHWNGQFLKCEVITCPETNISNAEICYQNTSLGGSVNYSCNTGSRYEKGDLLRVCVIGGLWSGDMPVCKKCRCPCSSVGVVPIKQDEVEKLEQRLGELKSNLTVLRNSTSKAIRSKISADDPRPSAKSLGFVLGAGILICVFGGIIISDLPELWLLLSCQKRM